MDGFEKNVMIGILSFALVLTVSIGSCIHNEKVIQTEAIKAGLHQEVVLKPGQSSPRVIWVK